MDLVVKEINRVGKTRASVVPTIVIGALGAIYCLGDWLRLLHIGGEKAEQHPGYCLVEIGKHY